jgi:hypothetical protein
MVDIARLRADIEREVGGCEYSNEELQEMVDAEGAALSRTAAQTVVQTSLQKQIGELRQELVELRKLLGKPPTIIAKAGESRPQIHLHVPRIKSTHHIRDKDGEIIRTDYTYHEDE